MNQSQASTRISRSPANSGKAGEEKITFAAADGFPLRGTVFRGSGNGPLVLISGAMGVPSGFYAKFAAALADAGSRAVMVWDYRGMPGSPAPKTWRGSLRARDWALTDFPAALARLQAEAPGHRVVGIGQSFGGQAFGISGVAGQFERYAFIAVLSGYWRNMQNPLRVFSAMQLLGLPVTLAAGRTLPFMGLGDTVPAPVYREWAQWCRNPHYLYGMADMPERERVRDVDKPILSIRHPDDPWGTEKAVEALLAHHLSAKIERRLLGPEQAGGEPVGHLGFFRSKFRNDLWPDVIDWLLDGPAN